MHFRPNALLLLWFVIWLHACKTTREITDPDIAWQEKKYAIAAQLYQKQYESTTAESIKANLAFKIAECYRLMGNSIGAEKWYQKADAHGYPDPEIYYYLGLMMKQNEKYEEAILQFKTYRREEPFNKQEAIEQIKACKKALEWKNSKTNCRIENLEGINTRYADFAPALFRNGALVFTSSRPEAEGDQIYGWTGEEFTDIFIAEKTRDGFSTPVSFDPVINTPFNEGTITFNKDFSEAYFTRCGSNGSLDDYCFIYRATALPGGGWRNPEPLMLFNDSVNTGHPALSSNGKRLFFAAEAKDGFGGKDIYVCNRQGDGWSAPINLGPEVNTADNEMFPWISPEGTLYFASDGHPGMGGLDIFSAVEKEGKWTNVTNLKYPINSGSDDFAIVFDKTKWQGEDDPVKASGYFSSNRPGGKGSDDIYRFVYENKNLYELKGVVKEKLYASPGKPNSGVTGLQPLSDAVVVLKELPSQKVVDSLKTPVDGTFYFELEGNKRYQVSASKKGYFTDAKEISTETTDPYQTVITLNVELILDKIFKEEQIVIPNIYYDFDKTTLREESKPVLDTLAMLLLNNPGIIVEIGSHTDSRGSDEYNLKLSEGRAKSVVDYLISKGVPPQRLRAKGYGETQLVNHCDDNVECTEEEHQQNRRTTFKVIGENFEWQSVTPENIRVDTPDD